MVGHGGDADGDVDLAEVASVEMELLVLDVVADGFGELFGAADGGAGEDDGEFFAAVAGGEVAAADALSKGAGDGAQNVVAGGVAEFVVEVAEMVDVDHEDGHAAVGALDEGGLVVEVFDEEAVVVEAGHGVAEGLVAGDGEEVAVGDGEAELDAEGLEDLFLLGFESGVARAGDVDGAEGSVAAGDGGTDEGASGFAAAAVGTVPESLVADAFVGAAAADGPAAGLGVAFGAAQEGGKPFFFRVHTEDIGDFEGAGTGFEGGDVAGAAREHGGGGDGGGFAEMVFFEGSDGEVSEVGEMGEEAGAAALAGDEAGVFGGASEDVDDGGQDGGDVVGRGAAHGGGDDGAIDLAGAEGGDPDPAHAGAAEGALPEAWLLQVDVGGVATGDEGGEDVDAHQVAGTVLEDIAAESPGGVEVEVGIGVVAHYGEAGLGAEELDDGDDAPLKDVFQSGGVVEGGLEGVDGGGVAALAIAGEGDGEQFDEKSDGAGEEDGEADDAPPAGGIDGYERGAQDRGGGGADEHEQVSARIAHGGLPSNRV